MSAVWNVKMKERNSDPAERDFLIGTVLEKERCSTYIVLPKPATEDRRTLDAFVNDFTLQLKVAIIRKMSGHLEKEVGT